MLWSFYYIPLNFPVKYFLFVFVQLGSAICFSQTNLVPNPGFEDMILCPNNGANLINTKYWTNPNLSSPDYFHTCGVSGYGVPSNVEGFQIAHSGNAYAGFIAFAMPPWPSSSFREYVQVRLDSNFVKDEIYCVTFYVSLADSLSEYAVNNIGAYFSSIAVSSNNYDPLPFTPQVTNTSANPLTDTSGWTSVSGQFKAQGGERYITIGNFNSNAASDTVFIQKTTPSYKTAYYYIDDVSVIHLDAGAGKARYVCNGLGVTLGRPSRPGITYSWYPAAGLSDTTVAQPVATPAVTTTYYLTATLTSSGCSKTDSVTVFYVPIGPTAALSLSDSTLCADKNGIAMAIINSTASPYMYSWSNGASATSTSQQMSFNNFKTGTYTVTITDAQGCAATASTTITAKDPCECGEDMYIANVFSPNNDGKNDVLAIEGNGLTNIYWDIYDRWGSLVFEAYDQTHSWDGTLKGSAVEAGVYSYYLRGTCVKTHGVVTLKGNVSIIK